VSPAPVREDHLEGGLLSEKKGLSKGAHEASVRLLENNPQDTPKAHNPP